MFFVECNTWKLIDLGSHALVEANAPNSYTLEYCSPEVAEAVEAGKPAAANPASDMWALGLIAYQLASGEECVQACSAQSLRLTAKRGAGMQ